MKLLDFFRDHNDEIVALLEELVIHESPTGDKAAVDALGDFVVEQLQASGAQVEIFPREDVGDILYASWNGDLPGKPILLLAHLDTVWPVGTLQDMPLWQNGVRLYGPGILDMKAGIALILKVMDLLHLHGGLPRRPIWALFTTDEETGSTYSRDLIEKVAEIDEHLMEKYVEGQKITPEEIRAGVRKGTVTNKLVPVLCGSAFKNKGVQPLMDAVVDYLPSPLDIPPIEAIKMPDGETVTREASDNEPFCALVFKITSDPYVGRLTYFRVYSGKVARGSTVFNVTRGKRQRLNRILRMHANRREEVDEVYAADIVAVVGLDDAVTGDTLAAEHSKVLLESIHFPEPVISVAIEPKTKADQEKMALALERLSNEDPTFKTHTDADTGQTIISGMGELHLEIILDRLYREFKVEANHGKPQVAYKETITRTAQGEGRYVKQTGGRGQYGHCIIVMEPMPTGTGIIFESKITGGEIPKEFIQPARQGIEEALESGVLAGFPVLDVKVQLVGGSFHEVDSSELSFKIAGSMAARHAVDNGNPTLKEPIMAVEVVVPEEFVGDVISDLNGRRGVITHLEVAPGGSQVIQANVPLAEMFGYATVLRSVTQGRASYTMEPSHYEIVPDQTVEQLVLKMTGRPLARR